MTAESLCVVGAGIKVHCVEGLNILCCFCFHVFFSFLNKINMLIMFWGSLKDSPVNVCVAILACGVYTNYNERGSTRMHFVGRSRDVPHAIGNFEIIEGSQLCGQVFRHIGLSEDSIELACPRNEGINFKLFIFLEKLFSLIYS